MPKIRQNTEHETEQDEEMEYIVDPIFDGLCQDGDARVCVEVHHKLEEEHHEDEVAHVLHEPPLFNDCEELIESRKEPHHRVMVLGELAIGGHLCFF